MFTKFVFMSAIFLSAAYHSEAQGTKVLAGTWELVS